MKFKIIFLVLISTMASVVGCAKDEDVSWRRRNIASPEAAVPISEPKDEDWLYNFNPKDTLHLGVINLSYNMKHSSESQLLWTGRLTTVASDVYWTLEKHGLENTVSSLLFKRKINRTEYPGVATHFEKKIDISGEDLIKAGFPLTINTQSEVTLILELATVDGRFISESGWSLPVVAKESFAPPIYEGDSNKKIKMIDIHLSSWKKWNQAMIAEYRAGGSPKQIAMADMMQALLIDSGVSDYWDFDGGFTLPAGGVFEYRGAKAEFSH